MGKIFGKKTIAGALMALAFTQAQAGFSEAGQPLPERVGAGQAQRSYWEDLNNPAAWAAAADGAATKAALNAGAREANPLLGQSPSAESILALTAAKVLLTPAIRRLDSPAREQAMGWATGIWAGASANNLLIAAGAGNPAGLAAGLVFGYWAGKRAWEQEKALAEKEHAKAGGKGAQDPAAAAEVF